MRQRFALVLVLLAPACSTTPPQPSNGSNSPQFAYCPPAKFANCTVAKCVPNGDNYTCMCFEDDRESATAWNKSQEESCRAATPTTLQSRYHPIEAYQECGSNAPEQKWAWCLGVKCTPATNATDPKANVACDCLAIPANVPPVPYIVTASSFAADNCSVKYWSSATPGDVSQITTFLQSQVPNLKQPVVLQPPASSAATSAGPAPGK